MKHKRYKRNLSRDEIDKVFALGYAIRVQWMSPVEGNEYRVSVIGQEKVLAFRKSARAAYNFVIKHAAEQITKADAKDGAA